MAPSVFAVLERDLYRRIIFGVLLAAAVAGIVVVAGNERPRTSVASDRDPAIEALIPTPGSDVLRQSEVGIDLAEGYQAELTVNGVVIPRDEITGIPAGDQQPALGRYVFAPGDGKAIDTWNAGPNCVTATFWKAADGRDRSLVHRWCFSAA